MKIQGNTDSIRRATIEALDSFVGQTLDEGRFIPPQAAQFMRDFSVEYGREIAVCLDRRNTVLSITLGDASSVSSATPDVGKRSAFRLCGVRQLHTHPNGVPTPSDVDLNTLADERFDASVVIGINCEKGTISGATVSLLGRGEDGSLVFSHTEGPLPPSLWDGFDQLFAYAAEIDKSAPETALSDNREERERAILVGVAAPGEDDDLAELAELAKTAGADVVERFVQRRAAPDSKYYIGSGLVEELWRAVGSLRADIVIFDDELSPSQIRNLEEKCRVRIVDRTALILDIFARRAASREGRLQVELAQQKYRLPRLTGLGTKLSRLGGGIGTRGPGETKLQTDRRHIMRKIHFLEEELDEVSRRRELLRRERKRREVPTASLVGYTNSGKSTLLNVLCDSDVYVEDQLFATLDPSVRRMVTDEREVLLTDTVGFIKKLPHELVEAFKSTLEEAVYTDLLIHVVDLDCEDYIARIDVVESILSEIGATDAKRFLVLNKLDRAPEDFVPANVAGYERVITTSAKDGRGIDELRSAILDFFARSERYLDILIPYSAGADLAYLHENGTVESEEYTAEGTRVKAKIAEKSLGKLVKYLPDEDKESEDER